MTTGRKVMVLGLDGMEPYTAKRLMDAGKMPNLKKMVENGAARENLELLGSMPTITPAQWTTLACGCNPGVDGSDADAAGAVSGDAGIGEERLEEIQAGLQ